MHKKKGLTLFFIGTMMLLGGIMQTVQSEQENTELNSAKNSVLAEADTSDMFSDRDKEVGYEETESIAIQLSDDGSSCESDFVVISENTVTIKDEGTYILSGTLTDGMVIVEAEDTDKIQIVLDNVTISNPRSAALYVRSADKVFVTTKAESENTLQNGGTYSAIDENNIDAAVFSKSDLTFNGEGTLNITADAGHGIVSKDDLVFTCGNYQITSAEHGISGRDSVRIANGLYTIVSGKDGIHAENTEDTSLGFVYLQNGTFDITAQQDGISAGAWLETEDGNYTILTGAGSAGGQNQEMLEKGPTEEQQLTEDTEENAVSIKGIKSENQMILKGGSYTIDAEDDAIHSNGDLTISDGSYRLASGDDGIHGDAGVTISGGSIEIEQSYEGMEGLSIDISGGEISILALDDGINAAGGNDSSGFEGFGPGKDQFASTEGAYICISGGRVEIDASGDGIDSNGDITVSGGETYLSGPVNNGNGSLDYSGSAVITGGVFAASGSSGMVQNFDSSSTQGVMMVKLNTQEADTTILLTDSADTELLSWTAKKEYSSVILSCPEIQQGETYLLKAGAAEESIYMESTVYGNSVQTGDMPAMGDKNIKERKESGMSDGQGLKMAPGERGEMPGNVPPDDEEYKPEMNMDMEENATTFSLESDSYIIENFPILEQMPELPTGCEITAMTMALNYYGYEADKVQMAEKYLPQIASADIYVGEDGILRGNDLNQYFIGDPTTSNGTICGTGAIVTAANAYLEDHESTLTAIEKNGIETEKLYEMIRENIPVVVWCTIGMEERQEIQESWYTENGEYVDWSRNDHGAVLIGYSGDTVTIADPISGLVEYEKEQFETVFESRGSKCVILTETEEI
ncbi:MAG: carbohydrate-binding domain-containing protein [Marvinbryantia sp.]|jgi:uncharacterized protein YvpB